MAEPIQQNQELTFNQYSVLIASINALRDEVRTTNAQMREVTQDHEDRLRRNELFLIVGLFVIIIAIIITFFVVREVVLNGRT